MENTTNSIRDLLASVVKATKTYVGNDPLQPWIQGIKKMKEILPPDVAGQKLPRFLLNTFSKIYGKKEVRDIYEEKEFAGRGKKRVWATIRYVKKLGAGKGEKTDCSLNGQKKINHQQYANQIKSRCPVSSKKNGVCASSKCSVAEETKALLTHQNDMTITHCGVGSKAVALLIRLPLDADAKKNLRHLAKMSSLVDLLHEGVIDTRIDSTTLLQAILEDNDNGVGFDSVSSFRFLFGLLRLVKDQLHPAAMEVGFNLLKVVCSCKAVLPLVVGIGFVAHLVELLTFMTTTGLECIVAILEMLGTTTEGKKAIRDCDLTIPNVVGVLMRVSEPCNYEALVVCMSAPKMCALVAVEAGLTAKLLFVIQSPLRRVDCEAVGIREGTA